VGTWLTRTHQHYPYVVGGDALGTAMSLPKNLQPSLRRESSDFTPTSLESASSADVSVSLSGQRGRMGTAVCNSTTPRKTCWIACPATCYDTGTSTSLKLFDLSTVAMEITHSNAYSAFRSHMTILASRLLCAAVAVQRALWRFGRIYSRCILAVVDDSSTGRAHPSTVDIVA